MGRDEPTPLGIGLKNGKIAAKTVQVRQIDLQHRMHWRRQRVVHPFALASGRDQIQVPHVLQVLGNGRLFFFKNLLQMTDAQTTALQQVQYS